MKIGFVTDSASDIPWDFAKKKSVKVVPLTVNYYNESHKEDENFDLDAYYQKFISDDKFQPKTAQPSPKLFMDVFKELIDKGNQAIIVVTISSQLSGTYNSARLAIDYMKGTNPTIEFHLVDSLNASYPAVFLVKKGLELAKKKLSADEIAKRLRAHVPKVKTRMFLESLRYLHLGGRISIAKYLLGRLLRKKALILVNPEGKLESFGTVNNIEDGLEALIKDATNDYKEFPRTVCLVHTNNQPLLEQLEKLVKEKIPKVEIRRILSGTTISAHTGPYGVALISNFD